MMMPRSWATSVMSRPPSQPVEAGIALPSVADDAVAGGKIAHEKAVDCGDDGDDAPASPNAGESLNQVGMGVQAVEGKQQSRFGNPVKH